MTNATSALTTSDLFAGPGLGDDDDIQYYFDNATSYVNEKEASYFTIANSRSYFDAPDKFVTFDFTISLTKDTKKVPFPKSITCTFSHDDNVLDSINPDLYYSSSQSLTFGKVVIRYFRRIGEGNMSLICMYSGLGSGTAIFRVSAYLGKPPTISSTRIDELANSEHYRIISDEEIVNLAFDEEADNSDNNVEIDQTNDNDITSSDNDTFSITDDISSKSTYRPTYINFVAKAKFETTKYTKPDYFVTGGESLSSNTSKEGLGRNITRNITRNTTRNTTSIILSNNRLESSPPISIHNFSSIRKDKMELSRTYQFHVTYSPAKVPNQMFSEIKSNVDPSATSTSNVSLNFKKNPNSLFTGKLRVEFIGVIGLSNLKTFKCDLTIIHNNNEEEISSVDADFYNSIHDYEIHWIAFSPIIHLDFNYKPLYNDKEYIIKCPDLTMIRNSSYQSTTSAVIPFAFSVSIPSTNTRPNSTTLSNNPSPVVLLTSLGSGKSSTTIISLPKGGAVPDEPLPDEDQRIPSDDISDSDGDPGGLNTLEILILIILILGLIGGLILLTWHIYKRISKNSGADKMIEGQELTSDIYCSRNLQHNKPNTTQLDSFQQETISTIVDVDRFGSATTAPR